MLTPPTRAIGPDPAYAPPEPLVGPTPAADVYALGCLLWTAATGDAPFTGTTIEAVREAHRTQRVPQLPGREPLTLATNRVLRLALSKDPMRRYSGAEALHADLQSSRWACPTPPRRRDGRPLSLIGDGSSEMRGPGVGIRHRIRDHGPDLVPLDRQGSFPRMSDQGLSIFDNEPGRALGRVGAEEPPTR